MKNLFELSISTGRRNELINITSSVQKCITESGIREGLCVIFVPHTTAGVTINENADPDVVIDIIGHLAKLVPPPPGVYRHSEGNSDSHIKSSLTGPSLCVIVSGGKAVLGTWQGIYFAEYDGPRHRKFIVKCIEG
ncbi:MAG: secondary thiamine-phosphate synthase enzyme YjbQ [Brevinematales bacterium]|jgi:secondary thiamine-phosphate synthase enzyme